MRSWRRLGRRYHSAIVSAVIVLGAISSSSLAKSENELLEKVCDNSDQRYSVDQQIASCTDLIASDQDKVVKAEHLFDRGVAFSNKLQDDFKEYFEKATSDFRSAFEVNPPHDGMGPKEKIIAQMSKYNADSFTVLDDCLNNSDRDRRKLSCSKIVEGRMQELDSEGVGGIHDSPWFKALAYKGLGLLYSDKKEFDRAVDDYSQSITLFDGEWTTYALRSGAYLKMHKYELAISDLNKAIRLEPHSANLYVLRCVAFGYEGRYKRALSDCEEAVRIDPNDRNAEEGRQWAHDRMVASRSRSTTSRQQRSASPGCSLTDTFAVGPWMFRNGGGMITGMWAGNGCH